MSEELLVEVRKHYLAKSKNGTPSIKFQVISCADPEDKLYFDCWLTDGAYKQTIKTLRETFGWDGNCLSDLNGTSLFIGTKAVAVIDYENYNGQEIRKIKFLNAVGGKSTLGQDEVEELNNQFLSAVRKYDGVEVPEEQEPTAKASDDDLPF